MIRTFPLALLLAAVPAAAQAAQVIPFGTGCTFQGQTLAIGNQGVPRIGSQFQVMYFGPNYLLNSSQQIAQPWLVLGLGQAITQLPQGLLPQQPPGCTGYITPDVSVPTMPDTNGRPNYENFIWISIPNDPLLLGYQFFGQWLLLFQQCGFAGCGFEAVPTSDAAVIQIGT